MEPGTPTLDQLRIFECIVEEGSFAGAARRLNRAVSVISYGIANLEAQLGLTLFDREGTKKPVLTEAGHAVLADARAVSGKVADLRARAKGLLDGLEAEVGLAVDVMFPADRLARILRVFAESFPTVTLRLQVEALGAVTANVLDGSAIIGVSGPLSAGVAGIDGLPAGLVTMIPVAAPDHPLARQSPLPPGAARDHTQLVLTDRSRATEGRDFSVVSPRTWRLGDLGAKHALLREGIGWGNMPRPMVEADLVAGTLLHLQMPDYPGGTYRFRAIWRGDRPPGPAAKWLVDSIVASGEHDAPAGAMADL